MSTNYRIIEYKHAEGHSHFVIEEEGFFGWKPATEVGYDGRGTFVCETLDRARQWIARKTPAGPIVGTIIHSPR